MSEYKRNFLTSVILRVDYVKPLDDFTSSFPDEILQDVKKKFVIAEHRDVIGHEFQISGDISGNVENVTQQKKIEREWICWDISRSKRLSLSSNAMAINFSKYTTFADLKEHFDIIWRSLKNKYRSSLEIRRLGLRYINEIEISGKNPFAWSGFINPKLSAGIEFNNLLKPHLRRSMTRSEWFFSEYNVNFAYGVYNPDYPLPIKKKGFVLDYDVYCETMLSPEQVDEYLPTFNAKIIELFEASIGNKLRETMNG